MATSTTEICNYALSMAQATLVDDISVDTSESARQCAALYPLVRDAVLRSHPWNCAILRQPLTLNLTAPSFEFDYSYALPADCLRALDLYGSDNKFEVENGNLLTNEADANLTYIAQITDVSKYDALLVEAIATKLAAKLAITLSNSRLYASQLEQQYLVILSEARRVNGQEGSPKYIAQKSGWTDSRYNYKAGRNPFRERK
jgi:hypothetical protein